MGTQPIIFQRKRSCQLSRIEFGGNLPGRGGTLVEHEDGHRVDRCNLESGYRLL